MKKVVTHNGGFHPDDVFAVACITILEGAEQVSIIRTREQSHINTADWVVDVGGDYDPTRRRFDHHQHGAPVRENGVPYAAFGLVWKHHGVDIAGNNELAQVVEERLCQAIDAPDNGINLFTLTEYQIEPVRLFHVLDSFKPVWGSEQSMDEAFLKAVEFAREFLLRFIERAKGEQKMLDLIDEVYTASEEKSVILFETKISPHALIKYPEVQAVVYPAEQEGVVVWSIVALPKHHYTFESRVLFPESWAGLRDDDLEKVSGIPGLFFCHKGRFICKATTQEAALRVAQVLAQAAD